MTTLLNMMKTMDKMMIDDPDGDFEDEVTDADRGLGFLGNVNLSTTKNTDRSLGLLGNVNLSPLCSCLPFYLRLSINIRIIIITRWIIIISIMIIIISIKIIIIRQRPSQACLVQQVPLPLIPPVASS